ncbi:MAG: sensor histidine kinase [Nitriliruptoraceae bacterium]
MREPNQGLVNDDAAVPSWLSRPGDRLAVYASAVGLERWARIAAVVITPLLLAERGFAAASVPLAGLAAYVLVTSLLPRNRYLRAADLLAAAALIAVAGEQIVAFLPFLLVAVAGPAAHGGLPAGILAGTVLSLLAVVRLAIDDELAVTGVAGVLPLTLLLILTGITTAIAAQVRRDQAVRDRLTLQHAHRILGELRDLSADLPGGLDDRSIAQATLAEVERLPGAAVAIALGPDHGQLRPLATFGTGGRSPRPISHQDLEHLLDDRWRPRSIDALPSGLLEESDPHLRWLVQPLDEDSPNYLLLAGFRPPEPVAATRGRLAMIIEDARIALDNARLFDDTHRLAQHAARRRVAGELHDGVAQSLTHLRMELELLASATDDGAQATELARLARVARTALEDLRGTIADLRAPGGDLGGMIERYLDDVRTPRGPRIEVDRQPGVEVSPQQADQAMRAVQEAVSNALQHAEANTIEVALLRDGEHAHLRIRDDGRGGVAGMPHPDAGSAQEGRGLGLASLRDRAERLGGRLEISEPDGGGTQITLTFPLEPDTSGVSSVSSDPGGDATIGRAVAARDPIPDRGGATPREERK